MYYDGFQFSCKNYSKELASTFHTTGRPHYSTMGDGLLRKKTATKDSDQVREASAIAVLQIIHECARVIIIVNILGHITIFS